MISVDEISRMTEKKNQIKKETYVKLYEQVSRKIRQSVNFGAKAAVCQVPSFVVGYPMFDRARATAYVKRQLERGGFTVTDGPDHQLHVTWTVKKASRPAAAAAPPEEGDLPSLINLKKAANKYRQYARKDP